MPMDAQAAEGNILLLNPPFNAYDVGCAIVAGKAHASRGYYKEVCLTLVRELLISVSYPSYKQAYNPSCKWLLSPVSHQV